MQTNFTPFAMVLIPVPHQQLCSWFGACWFCVGCPEMSMTQRCWAGYVALWSRSPPPMIPLESESRTQTSVQALSSHPQLAAPGQPVARWGWQFSPPLRFQKSYIDQIWVMTKCVHIYPGQKPPKEFSELVLPKKRLKMKKVKVPELVLLYSRNSSNT